MSKLDRRGFPWVDAAGVVDVNFLLRASHKYPWNICGNGNHAIRADMTDELMSMAVEHYLIQSRLHEMENGRDLTPEADRVVQELVGTEVIECDDGERRELPRYEYRYRRPPRLYLPSSKECEGCGRHNCWVGATHQADTRYWYTLENMRKTSIKPTSDNSLAVSIDLHVDSDGKVRHYRWVRMACLPNQLPWIESKTSEGV